MLRQEEELCEISKKRGVAQRDGSCGDALEKLAEEVMEVAGRGAFSGERFEWGAGAVQVEDALFFPGVEEAEQGMSEF